MKKRGARKKGQESHLLLEIIMLKVMEGSVNNALSPQVLKYPSLGAINHCVESNLIKKRYKKHSGLFLLLILISTRKRSTWGMKNRHCT